MRLQWGARERASNWSSGLRCPTADHGDCRLVCGDGGVVTWHRALLARQSAVLAKVMLEGHENNNCCGCDCAQLKYDTIMLPDFKVGAVRKVLEWLLTGKAVLAGFGEVQQVTGILQVLGISVDENDISCEEMEGPDQEVEEETGCQVGQGGQEVQESRLESHEVEEIVIDEEEEEEEEAAADEIEEAEADQVTIQEFRVQTQDSGNIWHSVFGSPAVEDEVQPEEAAVAAPTTPGSGGSSPFFTEKAKKTTKKKSSRCGLCSKELRDKTGLLRHLTLRHYKEDILEECSALIGSAVVAGGEGKYECPLCSKGGFRSRAAFIIHLGVTHRMVLKFVPQEGGGEGEDRKPLVVKIKKKSARSNNGTTATTTRRRGLKDPARKIRRKKKKGAKLAVGSAGEASVSRPCLQCDEVFDGSTADLLGHYAVAHYRDSLLHLMPQEQGDGCDLCVSDSKTPALTSDDDWIRHLGVGHGKVLLLLTTKERSAVVAGTAMVGRHKSGERLNACHLCSKPFRTSALARHYALTHFRTEFTRTNTDVLAASAVAEGGESHSKKSAPYLCSVCGSHKTGQDFFLYHLATAHRGLIFFLGPEYEQALFPKTKIAAAAAAAATGVSAEDASA